MKYLPLLAGILLGLIFIFAGSVVLFHLMPMPELPLDTTAGMFFAALGKTGYLTFIKIVEFVGGILVLIPRTRKAGLLMLGPVIVNILACNIFITKGEGLANPMVIGVVVCATYLVWVERKAFATFLSPNR